MLASRSIPFGGLGSSPSHVDCFFFLSFFLPIFPFLGQSSTQLKWGFISTGQSIIELPWYLSVSPDLPYYIKVPAKVAYGSIDNGGSDILFEHDDLVTASYNLPRRRHLFVALCSNQGSDWHFLSRSLTCQITMNEPIGHAVGGVKPLRYA